MILLLNVGHRSLTTAADGTGLPLQEGTRGVGLIELRAVLVHTGNQKCHTIRTSHRLALLAFVSLTEVDSQVTDSLGNLFNSHGLGVVETMVLCLNASMINQDAGITNDTTHCTTTVSVDLYEKKETA